MSRRQRTPLPAEPSADELGSLLSAMEPVLHDGVYVYSVIPPFSEVPVVDAVAMFCDAEGVTLIAAEQEALRAGLPVLFRAAWITLGVQSGLSAVGLTAAFSRALAQEKISCNVVAAAQHDHVFVPVEDGARAMACLQALQRQHREATPAQGPSPRETSVARHYETLLAPIYLWMAGGLEPALAAGAAEVATIAGGGGHAVDLGAGFGMHAIPLARAGYEVLALDSSPHLLAELRSAGSGLPVEAVEADLREFRRFLRPGRSPDLVLCMGDTLPHLPDRRAVEALARDIAASLAPGGRFVATFRDYTRLPAGTARFIPVRSAAQRIHTCFLEEDGADHVRVHDILHELQGSGWTTRVGSYRKLRLPPGDVADLFRAAGLRVSLSTMPSGMVRLAGEA